MAFDCHSAMGGVWKAHPDCDVVHVFSLGGFYFQMNIQELANLVEAVWMNPLR